MRPGRFILLRAALVAALGALAAGCATVSVATDYDKSVDLSRYRSFNFVGGHLMVHGVSDDADTLVKDRIRNAVVGALQRKGLQQTAANPQLLVGYMGGARTRTEIEMMPPYGPELGPYGYPGWWTPGYSDWWAHTYEEGTLVIDLIDAQSRRLLWRSYVRAEVNPPLTDQKIDDAVNKAFKSFPPRP